jgi:hypothetical protein
MASLRNCQASESPSRDNKRKCCAQVYPKTCIVGILRSNFLKGTDSSLNDGKCFHKRRECVPQKEDDCVDARVRKRRDAIGEPSDGRRRANSTGHICNEGAVDRDGRDSTWSTTDEVEDGTDQRSASTQGWNDEAIGGGPCVCGAC